MFETKPTVSVGNSKAKRGSPTYFAHRLIDMGVPVFVASLDKDGDPKPPKGWQRTRPDHAIADKWRPGRALCAVTGVVFDVIDVDPRNGGRESFIRFAADLGDDGPDVYWKVKTPSGGVHYYIATMRIRSAGNFLPGLDLKAGDQDGEGRGFVFLPPTVRPSKVDTAPRAYWPLTPLSVPDDVGACATVRGLVVRYVAERGGTGVTGGSAGREAPSALRAACVAAGPGEQRGALLRYTHELERKGNDRADIVALLRALVTDPEWRNFNPDDPWYPARGSDPAGHLRGLLHRKGEVMADATADEAADLATAEPIRSSGLVMPFSEVEDEDVAWLWDGYLAFGCLAILDGEKGQGKSLVTIDISARTSRGLAMPGADAAICDPLNVLLLGTEDTPAAVRRRLRAADADLSRVQRPKIERDRKRGKAPEMYLLPGAAPKIGQMIREAGAGLVILDPITDFLDETVNSHNDASVRRALAPLAIELERAQCAGLALRHMNKDTRQDARFRGTGSSAFQNRGRVHLIAARMPESYPGLGGYGLAMVDNNLVRNESVVLTYSIVDSTIKLDTRGNMVPRLEWYEPAQGIDANAMTRRDGRRGPAPVVQDEIEEVLLEMFSGRDEWPAKDALAELREAGVSATQETISKVRAKLGIKSRQRAGYWAWVAADKFSTRE